MIEPIVGLTIAYVAIAVLLLSLNVTSSWKWWIKGTAIVATTVLYGFTYQSVQSLLGWPSEARLPKHFQLHWGTVMEPDKFLGTPGAIYLWAEELDDQNYPVGTPRAYRQPYTKELAEKIQKAIANIEAGHEQAGTAEEMEGAEGETEQEGENLQMTGNQNDENLAGSERDPDALLNRQHNLEFQDLPPPQLATKPTF
jgi:hypothetical protein